MHLGQVLRVLIRFEKIHIPMNSSVKPSPFLVVPRLVSPKGIPVGNFVPFCDIQLPVYLIRESVSSRTRIFPDKYDAVVGVTTA